MRHKRTTAATQSHAKQPNQAAIFISRGINFTPQRAEANVGAAGDPARPPAGPGGGRWGGSGYVTIKGEPVKAGEEVDVGAS